MSKAGDDAFLDLIDLIRQENVRFVEALESLARDLRASGESASAAREALAAVSSRLDHVEQLDRIERRLGILGP